MIPSQTTKMRQMIREELGETHEYKGTPGEGMTDHSKGKRLK